MERQSVKDWIEHPECLNEETLDALKKLLERYPYFQALRMLYLKNLYLLRAPEFGDALRRNAFFMADLSLLFYYIEGSSFRFERVSKKEERGENPTSDRTLDLIEEFLAKLPDDSSQTAPAFPAEVGADYTEQLLNLAGDASPSENVKPLKGQELIDDFIKNSSETYKLTDSRVENDGDEQNEKNEETVDLSSGSEENYFTETLAQIYIRQKRYEKALEIIKKLNLKYPKKNTYFADQIRFLEKLIINAKTK